MVQWRPRHGGLKAGNSAAALRRTARSMPRSAARPHTAHAPLPQSAVRLRGSPVEPEALFDVAGAVPATAARGLLAAARSGQFKEIQAAVSDLIADGYPAQVRRVGVA